MEKRFDPFNDRTSRDIRNTLSSALVSELSGDGRLRVQDVARQWLLEAGDAAYQNYIRQCLVTYHSVLQAVQSAGLTERRIQAVVLWNAKLFFEVHELIETVWLGTHGDERKALKGLIQAAGVFVHRRRGHFKAANGLARRAMENLKHASPHLDFIEDLTPLLASLEDLSAPPPRLTPGSAIGDAACRTLGC
ncbi:MAG: DUF309 domain-containing protein [Desulfobacteraceae bacterium]